MVPQSQDDLLGSVNEGSGVYLDFVGCAGCGGLRCSVVGLLGGPCPAMAEMGWQPNMLEISTPW